jgi:hypothetical protein
MMALLGERPLAPGATGTRFIAQEQRLGRGWPRADEGVKVPGAGAEGPEVGDLSPVLLCDGSDGQRVFVDLPSALPCARLAHG